MNTPMEKQTFQTLDNIMKNKVLKIVLIAIFFLAVIANGIQGYFLFKKAKAYHKLEVIIENKSNCPQAPAQVETPAEPTPTPTTTKRKGSTPSADEGTDSDTSPIINPSPDTSTPEVVIPPPPPPID